MRIAQFVRIEFFAHRLKARSCLVVHRALWPQSGRS